MRRSLLTRLAALVRRHPIAIVLISAALAVAGGVWAAAALELNANTDDLIGRDRPFMKKYRRFLETFGDLEYIHVLVDDHDRGTAPACVDWLVARLETIPQFPLVAASISGDEQLALATRAMPTEELRRLADVSTAFPALISDEGSGRIFDDAREGLETLTAPPASHRGRDADEHVPDADATLFLLGALDAVQPSSPFRDSIEPLLPDAHPPRYMTTTSGRYHTIAIKPVKDYGTLAVIEGPLQRLRDLLEEARSVFPDVEIGLTGKPVLQADELATTNRDMTRSALIAIALVSALFVILIGGWRQPLLAVVALIVGGAWTYGVATAAVGQLNLLSIVFVLVLIGVGLDYGIHVIVRYREARGQHRPASAIERVMATAVQGNMTGALTSSAVFFTALLTDFQGLRELGLIAGVGLLLCVIAATLLLPALLTLTDRTPHPVDPGPCGDERDFLRALDTLTARPHIVLPLTVAVTVALLLLPGRPRFESNLLELQADGLDSVVWQLKLSEDSDTWFGAVIVDTLAEVQTTAARARARATIGSVRSILDLIEPPSDERARLRAGLHAHLAVTTPDLTPAADDTRWIPWSPPSPRDLIGAAARLEQLASATPAEPRGATIAALAASLRGLSAAVESGAISGAQLDAHVRQVGAGLRTMLAGDRLTLRDALPSALRPQLMAPNGQFLLTLHPNEDVWEIEPMRRFVDDLRSVDPEATGVPMTHFESMLDMRAAFQSMTLWSIGVVFVLLFIDFRRLSIVLLTLVPLGIGMLWTVALMGMLGVSFNLANFFAVPVLIGLSIDSGVHIMHRYLEGHPGRMLGATRRAVVVTALTTAIGFGSLLFAHHHGLRSLGFAMVIGTLTCLVATIVILPALLAWLQPRVRAARSDEGSAGGVQEEWDEVPLG